MNISRHNYEEFFLMYVDNELSAPQRNAVELFVQQNPDLAKELQLLQQAVVQEDEIIFDDKQSLLKDGTLAMQEKLMLFADDELPLEEKSAMFTLLAADSSAAAEWKILQKTKLQPDESIVFEDKASLYRTEGGRVIGIKWWRIAAAAVLLGFGIWLGANLFKSNKQPGSTGTDPIANGKTEQPKQNNEITDPSQVKPIAKEDPSTQIAKTISPQKNEVKVTPEKKNLVKGNDNNNAAKDRSIKQNYVRASDNNNNILKEVVQDKKPSNNLPKLNLEDLNNRGSNKNVTAIVQPKTPENINSLQRPTENKTDVAIANKEKQIQDINLGAATNSLAKNAVYNDAEEGNGDTRILYMDEDKVKKTKIGGFFRRLKRVVERTTNIKTGNSVKVAGFEIAIK